MFKHYDIATMGVRAGHKLMSILGFGYRIEVIVTPIHEVGGGGLGKPYLIPDLREYNITIRISKNGKIWEKSYVTDQTGLTTLEYVIATFKGIKKTLDYVITIVSSPIININKILVRMRKKK